MKIAHLSLAKRSDGHKGGVPKFGYYAERFLGATNIGWTDYPMARACEQFGEHEKAVLLGVWLWKHGELQGYERILADGFWANGLPDEAPVTVVCHGTWAELERRCGGVPQELIRAQDEAFHRWPVVAVSDGAARQLREHHGVTAAAVIENGVDVSEYRPAARAMTATAWTARPVCIHVANSTGKGGVIVEQLRRRMPEWEFRFLGAEIGEEADKFRAGDVFCFPSRHEGCSYALLEALACGLPTVASAVGSLEGREGSHVFGVVIAIDATAADYEAALREVYRRRQQAGQAARLMAHEFSAEKWTQRWRIQLQREE